MIIRAGTYRTVYLRKVLFASLTLFVSVEASKVGNIEPDVTSILLDRHVKPKEAKQHSKLNQIRGVTQTGRSRFINLGVVCV
jgi:hypothetical protein